MPDLNRSLLSEGENADTLGGLVDVTLTTPEEFQGLAYNGTEWVNSYQPTVSYVRNAEANTLTTGTVVYLFGGTGDHASVKRADYTSDTTSSKTVGLVGANIVSSGNGPVITRGYVDGIDLSTGYSVGDVLWLGTNGQFTTTKTVAPNHLVYIGVVVRATSNGIIYVATQNGYELDELHNVAIANTLTSGDFLKYNGTLWVNDQIDLSTDTVGNYVAGISGTANEISVSGSGSEGASVTISLPANVTISNNLVVTGDLTVSGNTTTLNTANLNVEDSFILLNSGVTGSPTLNAGIEVERGTSTNVLISWDETTDKWQFTNDGSTYDNIAGTASPTFTGTVTGSPAAGTTATGTSGFGYMGLPQNSATTGAYEVVAADAGKHIYSTATRTITIPPNANVAMPVGTTLVFIAGTGATVTIAITSDTMYLAGIGSTGSRTLAAFGMATAVKIASTTWIISGNGLT